MKRDRLAIVVLEGPMNGDPLRGPAECGGDRLPLGTPPLPAHVLATEGDPLSIEGEGPAGKPVEIE